MLDDIQRRLLLSEGFEEGGEGLELVKRSDGDNE